MSSVRPEPPKSSDDLLDFAIEVLNEAAPGRGTLLDLPCGTGHLSMRARETGWHILPCDLHPDFWEGDPDVAVQRCNFNELLPFDEDSADAIAHCEGIEHVENPWQILREFRRVLRPGGTLVLSFPSTIDVRQRLRMLRRGYIGHYLPRVPEHVNPMGTFYLCHALIRTGWAIESVSTRQNYGGIAHRVLARFMGFGKHCGLPNDVREMLSRSDVLRARTVYVVARPVGD